MFVFFWSDFLLILRLFLHSGNIYHRNFIIIIIMTETKIDQTWRFQKYNPNWTKQNFKITMFFVFGMIVFNI